MRRVLIDPAARRLPPGEHFLEIVAPAAVIDALGARPDLTNQIGQIVINSTPGAKWLGGGKQWSPDENGEARLVYGARVRVPEAQGGAAVALAVPVVPLVWAISGLLVASGFVLWSVRFYQIDPQEVGEVIDRVADTARSVRDVALLAGGLTVAYLVARRQGWLS